MKSMRFLWPGVLLCAVVFGLVNLAEAQVGRIEHAIELKSDGRILIDGVASKKASYDILADKYTWRYKAVDMPSQSIGSLTVNLSLPPGLTVDAVKPAIFAVHGVGTYGVKPLDERTLAFNAEGISTGATVTFTADLPKSALHFSSWQWLVVLAEAIAPRQWLVIALTIPGLMLILSLIVFAVRAADIFLKPASIQQLEPPSQLAPALVGVLLDGYVDVREIAATLIDLARRGYIDIIYRGRDFAFSQKGHWREDPKLHDFERFFLSQLLTDEAVSSARAINRKLSGQIWSEDISQAIDRIYDEMIRLGYFPKNPKQVHVTIRFIGIMIFFASVVGLTISLLFFMEQPFAALPWLVTIISTPLITKLALVVPQRTAAGREQASRWLAFRETLTVSTPAQFADQSEIFEVNLAYAVVMGVESEWTDRFRLLACQMPTWFFSQAGVISTYADLAEALFGIIGFVASRFSVSRKPTAL